MPTNHSKYAKPISDYDISKVNEFIKAAGTICPTLSQWIIQQEITEIAIHQNLSHLFDIHNSKSMSFPHRDLLTATWKTYEAMDINNFMDDPDSVYFEHDEDINDLENNEWVNIQTSVVTPDSGKVYGTLLEKQIKKKV